MDAARAATQDHALLKAPTEGYARTYRTTQRLLEKEISTALTQVNELGAKQLTPEAAEKSIDGLINRLQTLKRKLVEHVQAEDKQLNKCAGRVSHVANSRDTRLERFLVDYLLRLEYYEPAATLAKETGLTDLVEIELFTQAKKILDSLRTCSATAALAWASENRARLKKAKSRLEFDLRLQEFVEMARKGSLPEALAYARKFFPPFAETNAKEMQQAMASLAFLTGDAAQPVSVSTYEWLFAPERWAALRASFLHDLLTVNGLSSEPMLPLLLHYGLASLKTTTCGRQDHSLCPTCTPPLSALAADMPPAHVTRSYLICRISGQLMDEHNPPLVLPNGRAYSKKALMEFAAANDGYVVCPVTGSKFALAACKKAFIL